MNIKDLKIVSVPLTIVPFYTDKQYNEIRRLKMLLISDALNNFEQFRLLTYDEKINMMRLIENSCLNESVRKSRAYNIRCSWETPIFEKIYHSICFNIISIINVKLPCGSQGLLCRIFKKEIDLEQIASMTCLSLCPEKYAGILEKIEKCSSIESNVKYSELYFCKKCKNNKTITKSVQTRSNDEGNSVYITCTFCHNRWFG